MIEILAKLDVLQTHPFNPKVKQNKKHKDPQRPEAEKNFIASLWEEYFEIMRPKPEDDVKEAKKTPRKNWEVKHLKRDLPVPKGAITETLKVLINPYLG
jgi:hypothetical protein